MGTPSAILAAIVASGALLGCRCGDRAGSAPSRDVDLKPLAASPDQEAARATSTAKRPARRPKILGELPRSAYRAELLFQDGVPLVVTDHEIVRFAAEGMLRFEVELGPVRAIWGDDVVFWRDGRLARVPLSGGPVRVLGKLETQPFRLLASRDRIAWLGPATPGGASIFAWHEGGPREIHRSQIPFSTGAMADDWVYFVEQPEPGAWRLGAVSVIQPPGQAPARTALHSGRTPATLVAADALYLYDGPTRTVRRLSFDLSDEATIAQDVICSPLAVAARVYCAHVEGVFEVGGSAVVQVLSDPGGPITSLAATDTHLAVLVDRGEDRLGVLLVEQGSP